MVTAKLYAHVVGFGSGIAQHAMLYISTKRCGKAACLPCAWNPVYTAHLHICTCRIFFI